MPREERAEEDTGGSGAADKHCFEGFLCRDRKRARGRPPRDSAPGLPRERRRMWPRKREATVKEEPPGSRLGAGGRGRGGEEEAGHSQAAQRRSQGRASQRAGDEVSRCMLIGGRPRGSSRRAGGRAGWSERGGSRHNKGFTHGAERRGRVAKEAGEGEPSSWASGLPDAALLFIRSMWEGGLVDRLR